MLKIGNSFNDKDRSYNLQVDQLTINTLEYSGVPGRSIETSKTYLSIFCHWHHRIRSLRQGVWIWNFEEKKENKTKKQNKQKKRKIFLLCFD